MRVAADDRRLLAHADLAHVDALVELAREVAHQLTEVDPLLGREVAHGLAPAKEELDAHGLHVQARLGDEPAERGKGILALLG